MTITSPKYSFVKFDPDASNLCCDDDSFCVSVLNENDNFFQFKISGADGVEALNIWNTATVELILLKGSGNADGTLEANTLRNWTIQDGQTFNKVRVSAVDIIYIWNANFLNLSSFRKCNECFQLALSVTFGEVNTLLFSNCFKKICDECFTSVIEYFNEDDYGEFQYCNLPGFVNRVRLPFYLYQPQSIEDKVVYRKSTGAIKQTKSLLTKEYEVITEFFPGFIHDKLTVALGHESINIISDSYAGGISKSSAYAIEYNDKDCLNPASFKALATPYAISNSNCAACVDYMDCVGVAIPDFTLPDAIIGVAYNQTIILSGDQPFELSSVVKPVWMFISVLADVVTFSGTPTASPGSTLSIPFQGNTDAAHAGFTLAGIPVIGDAVNVDWSTNPNDTDPPNDYSISSTFLFGWSLADLITDLFNKMVALDSNTTLFSTGGNNGARAHGFSTASISVSIVAAEVSTLDVSFDASNACGSASVSTSINVVPPCVGVVITSSSVLPDGVVGTPYNFVVTLSGTAPFGLGGGQVVPTWMIVSIVGATIVFSGTPDATGIGLTVQVFVTNCATDSDFINTVIRVT